MPEDRGSKVIGYISQIVGAVVPIALVIAAYYIISGWLNGPLNSLKDLYSQQYNEYIKELKQYNHDDNGNLTTEHLNILLRKENNLAQIEGGIMQLGMSMYQLIAIVTFIVASIAGGVYLFREALINKYYREPFRNKAQTGHSCGYVAICMEADDMAAAGNWTQSMALRNSAANFFQTVTAPAMQLQIDQLTSQLDQVVGWQYLYYLYMIEALTFELSAIPALFALLPLPP